MPQVIVHVNDRPFNMVCDEGEEEHLTELASLIEAEVVKLKRTFGQVGDSRLLLMAGLVVADKLSEALNRIETLEEEMDGLKDARGMAVERMRDLEHSLTERVLSTAERVERLTNDLNAASK
jgi:cell division protein ZapA